MAYLDHAATTPVRPVARAALDRVLDHPTANASAVHGPAQAVRTIVEEARERVAACLDASPHDVVFTAGGTEADNLAVQGLAHAARQHDGRRHLVVSAVEHPAVLGAARALANDDGFDLTEVGVDRCGRVDPDAVVAALRPDTALVSVMLANNELGTRQDLVAVAAAVHAVDDGVRIHTDAVQAVATQPVGLEALGVDALSVSGHKLGAPIGVGALVLRRGVPVRAVQHGGGQERELRPGTLAHPLLAAFAAGLDDAVGSRAELVAHASRWRERLRAALSDLDGVAPTVPDDVPTLPTHLHLVVDGVDGGELLFALDRGGVAVAGGAACASGAVGASHVVTACGIEADAVLRVSTGWTTTDADIDRFVEVLGDAVPRLRAGRPVLADLGGS